MDKEIPIVKKHVLTQVTKVGWCIVVITIDLTK